MIYSDQLVRAVAAELEYNDCPLSVGGDFVSRAMEGRSLRHVLDVRASLRDGDLLLNNVVLVVDRQSDTARFGTPVGLVDDVLQQKELRMRGDWSDLRTAERLARRVFRTIAKAVRFRKVANLTISSGAMVILRTLAEEYLARIQRWEYGDHTLDTRRTARWLSDLGGSVNSLDEARHWLYEQIVVETSIRCVGVDGVFSSDEASLANYLEAPEGPLNEPLVQTAGEWLLGEEWFPNASERAKIRNVFLTRFAQYQQVGAQQLRGRFS